MKKQIGFVLLAMVAMLGSCTSESSYTAGEDVEVNGSSNSNVLIRLSSGSNATRASIESDGDGLFETDSIGIFCLAKGNLSINPRETDITWNANDAYASRYSVWVKNVMADAKKNETSTAVDLVWTDGADRWYPTGNWHSYRFYGYYPYTESIRYSDTRIEADMKIDGNHDIIYGFTENSDPDAYSAYYFRKDDNSSLVPELSFKHKLMRLTFEYGAGKDADKRATDMGIDSIILLNVPTSAMLVVADRDNKTLDGMLTANWYSTQDLNLLDEGNQPLGTEYWVPAEGYRSIGQGFLVPVPEGNNTYQVRVVLKSKDGEVFYPERPMDLNKPSDSTFVAGKSYTVRMKINGPKKEELQAKLAEWVPDSTTVHEMEF